MTNDGTKEGPGRFVLVYKLTSEPSRYRASVRRKLRGAGAVYPQSGVAALPDDPAGGRKMRGVVREILEKFAASVYEAADHGLAGSP